MNTQIDMASSPPKRYPVPHPTGGFNRSSFYVDFNTLTGPVAAVSDRGLKTRPATSNPIPLFLIQD